MYLAVVTVALLSIVGAVLLIALSPHGVHATNDSFTYLGAADSLARGEGWTYPFGEVGSPVTLFPPLYPAVLALPELLGVGTFAWVTWQNAVLFAVFSAVVGLTVATATRGSAVAAAVAVALISLGTPTVITYARIWSETIFLPLVVAILACLDRFLVTRRTVWLMGSSVLMSLALLTRYAGLAVFAASCLLLVVWPRRRIVERVRHVALFAGIALPASAAWLIRNQVRSGTLTGDNELIHGLTLADVVEGFRTIGSWFFHDPSEHPGRWPLVIVTAAAVVVVAVWTGIVARRREPTTIGLPSIVAVCLTYVIVHVSFIAIADAFSTRAPPFNDRILGPAFPPLMIAVVVIGHAVWVASPHRGLRIALAAGTLSLLASSVIAAAHIMPGNYGTRIGSEEEYGDLSDALEGVIGRGPVLLSNRPNVAWFIAGEPVSGLPRSCRGGRVFPDPTYPRELRLLAQRLADEPRQVLVFKNGKECEPFSVDGLKETLRLTRLARLPKIIVLEGPSPL